MRRNVPKVVVAITDGRSQDEVKKNAARLQHAGRCHTNVYLHASVSQMSSVTNCCKQTKQKQLVLIRINETVLDRIFNNILYPFLGIITCLDSYWKNK